MKRASKRRPPTRRGKRTALPRGSRAESAGSSCIGARVLIERGTLNRMNRSSWSSRRGPRSLTDRLPNGFDGAVHASRPGAGPVRSDRRRARDRRGRAGFRHAAVAVAAYDVAVVSDIHPGSCALGNVDYTDQYGRPRHQDRCRDWRATARCDVHPDRDEHRAGPRDGSATRLSSRYGAASGSTPCRRVRGRQPSEFGHPTACGRTARLRRCTCLEFREPNPGRAVVLRVQTHLR